MCANLSNSILLKELKIYQWIFSIFGLNFPPFLIYRQQKDIKYYLILIVYLVYSLSLAVSVIWVAYKHNQIVKTAAIRYQLDSITEIFTYLQNNSMATMMIILEYKNWFCHRNLLNILQMIKQLEEHMLTMCSLMFKEQNLRQRLVKSIGVFLLILILFFIYLNYFLIASDLHLIDKLLVIFFLTSVELKCLEYGIYVQLIYEYLKMLLKSLKCLNLKVENEKQRKQALAWYYTNTLRQNQESLMELWYLIYKLETYFAWPIFLLFFHNAIVILCTVNWAYVQYSFGNNPTYQMFRLIFVLLPLINIWLLCYLAQKCINKYQQFSLLLLNFKLYPHDIQMIKGVREYSLQLMHQHIKFTCNGYMDIDLSCFGKTTLLILAYSIILVQFKLNDISEGVRKATESIFGKLKLHT